ncbi:hypothetical protein HYALB_00012219 [Hymenoscyphus albidus]|uniref:Aminotransferase class V domain-containing protein n=1 Tax=Hymenoscyphus albidus TaxID=595503 RepID=A0A9N9LUS0_9HELO|nr:hypothetical protein HYALB_00012219 [Hymenoscyphus albidus]
MGNFSIASSREAFPALKQEQVFFDNAGGSQTLGSVIDSICEYLSKTNVQLGATYNIVLGSSTTQLFRNLSFAFDFPEGSEIICSSIDHESNISAWVDLASRRNYILKWWTPKTRENPKLLAEDLKELLSEKTALVTCTHASNILGTIHDIKAIVKVVRTIPDALLCVDAVAYAPHRQIDVRDLGVDFYCLSWYKVYGPHMSMLYASYTALMYVKSLGHFFNPSASLQDKLGLAGSSYELVASIPSVLSYFGPNPTESWAAIEKHEFELQSALLNYLNARSDVTICGEKDADTKKRVATVSFLVKGRKSEEVVEKVDELSKGNMGIRWGGFYSVRLLEDFLGLEKDGVVRVSMVHYNTSDEVKVLLGLFDQVLGKN